MIQDEITVDSEISVQRLRMEDALPLYALIDANRDYLARFMPWATPQYSLDDAKQFIERSSSPEVLADAFSGGIFFRRTLAGDIGIRGFKSVTKTGEIGYWLAESLQGRGIVTRCCRKLIDLGFGECGLHRIQIRAATANIRSRRIPQRLGLTHEGTLRGAGYAQGQFHDLEVYAVLEHEWRRLRGQAG